MMDMFVRICRRIALAITELLTHMVLDLYVWIVAFAIIGFVFRNQPELFYSLELLLFAAMLAIARWRVRRADRLSAQVGTVRRGTAAEKEADKVLFHFDLADRIGGLAMALLLPAFCLSFIIIDTPFLLWLHHALLIVLLVWHYRLSRRLQRIKQARGYGDYTRLA